MGNKVSENLKSLNLKIRQLASKMKKEVGALYFAYRRKDVHLYAKLVSVIVVGYALSPIDLIPDFVPVLGYLDDIILVPLGIAIAVRLIPKNIMNECRKQAEEMFQKDKHKSWIAGAIIISIWVVIAVYIIYKLI